MYSQAVTHPSTNTARCCLTSVIGRELVNSTWYGRRQFTITQIKLSNKVTEFLFEWFPRFGIRTGVPTPEVVGWSEPVRPWKFFSVAECFSVGTHYYVGWLCCPPLWGSKMWNASRFCVSSLRRGHANLLCIVPILVYVLPKQVLYPKSISTLL